jgi:hypothetical protein
LDDQPVEGLIDFPVEEYLSSVQSAFPEALREPKWVCWENPAGPGVFEIQWSPVHVLVSLHTVEAEHANQLVEIAANLDAPLYDPQTHERFDSWLDA